MKHHTLRWALLCVAAASGLTFASPVAIASPQSIVVKRGDTVESLARKHKVKERALARANDISVSTDLRRGRRLIIPDKPGNLIRPATMRRAAAVEADRVSLRIGPDEDRRRVALLDSGTRLIATRKAGDWYQVKTADGEYGWIRSDLIRVGKELPTPRKPIANVSKKVTQLAMIKMVKKKGAGAARITSRRPMPMYPKPVAGRLPSSRVRGSVVLDPRHEMPVDSNSIQVASNLEGESEAAVPDRRSNRSERLSRGESSGAEPRSGMIRTAFAYRGVPYRFGGTTRRGIDCSAFVGAVFRSHGISLPRTAREQATRGLKIEFEDMEEGDMVFFHTTRAGISHVGIYIGEGKFVHSSSAGGGVRVDSIMEGYYRKRFRGARRVSKP